VNSYKVIVEVNPAGLGCNTGEFCVQTAEHGIVPESPFNGPWWVYLPNIFSPNGDGINDYFYVSFGGMNKNCDPNTVEPNKNVYYAKISIFDRWGGLMFEKESLRGVNDPQGVNGQDLKWDGKVNGVVVNQGVYAAVLEVHSCYPNPFTSGCTWSWACFDDEGPTWCDDEHISTRGFDITVIY